MDRMQTNIDQIKQIFPDLGEGYIEVALKCYSMNVDETVTRLLDPSSLHPRLRAVDSRLPRAKPKNGAAAKKVQREDDEAKAAQKRYLREMEEREERDALIAERLNRTLNIGEGSKARSSNDDASDSGAEYDPFKMEAYDNKDPYDDDYDDQFDDMGDQHVKVGSGGSSFLADELDYESVKRYNAMLKDEEKADSFWEDSRNTNRQTRNNTKSSTAGEDDGDEDEDKANTGKKWGPDKIKGGRALGPDGKPLPRKRNNKKSGGGGGGDGSNDGIEEAGANENSKAAAGGRPNQKKGGQKGPKPGEGGKSAGGKESEDMSKIQKRRKNDNKAKVGNHNRKDRALKKGGGAM
jgi:activating signal cointegrator complex subunit 2